MRIVRMQVPGRKPRTFDLATSERDVVAECKAFSWTRSGNVPSAKIDNLREAVENLRNLGDGVARYLILDRATRPSREETLAKYFVRLNDEILGPVNVLELSDDGRLLCLHGVHPDDLPPGGLPEASGPTQAPPSPATAEDTGLSTGDLNALRTKLLNY